METKAKIKKIIKESLGQEVNDKVLDKPLKEFGIDSLQMIETIMKIEQELSIMLPDDELMKIKTLNDLFSLVETQLKK